MTEKTASKYLINLQSQFTLDSPVLQSAVKVFHELDQFEYDLGLLTDEQTTAVQTSWWPIVSIIGGNSGAKENFLARHLNVELPHAHKMTVLTYNQQGNQSILPGSALDVDYRYPFYHISHKIDQLQKNEGQRINSYLELKTLQSECLKGKLVIDIPKLIHSSNPEVTTLLNAYSVQQSDLVLVFCDLFSSNSELLKQFVSILVEHQETNKIIYIFDDLTSDLSYWQKKLAEWNLKIGQFIPLSQLENINSSEAMLFEQRLSDAKHRRAYRVLHVLENKINDVDDVVFNEIRNAIYVWKERSTFSTLIILGFIAMVGVFAEVEMGLFALLLDPIVGTAFLLALTAFMVPTHVTFCKLQAKVMINSLNKRQKELQLLENLAHLFEQNLTFKYMMLPTMEPVGWNKKTKAQLALLRDKVKDLVQNLNDNFSLYNTTLSQPVRAKSPVNNPSATTVTPATPHDVTVYAGQSLDIDTVQSAQSQHPAETLQPQTAQTPPPRQSALMQKILKK